MKQERLLQVIKGPYVTEKTAQLSHVKQLVFRVDPKANKQEISQAVEQLLKVKVIAVNSVYVKGKEKRFAQRVGSRKNYKKAYVSLDQSADMEALLSEQT